jgi:hypothetical protein
VSADRTAYPLAWPIGWPRAVSRAQAPFHRRKDTGKGYDQKVNHTMAGARGELQRQLDLLGAKSVLLSTNVELNLNGEPRGDRARPVDVGVACYFQLGGRDTVLACDKWTRVEDNVVAIAKHIDAMRGQQRWGVGSVEQAFTGYAALPAPTAKPHWTRVLGLTGAATASLIQEAYRLKARATSGNEAALLELNIARDEALQEVKSR